MQNYEILNATTAEHSAWKMNSMLDPRNMVTMSILADVSQLEELKQTRDYAGVSYTAIVMRAAALTLQQFPEANRAILGPPFFKKLIQFHSTDIGVAVEKTLPFLPGQAFATVIRDVDSRPMKNISQELKELVTCTEQTNPQFKLFMWILKKLPTFLSLMIVRSPEWSAKLWLKYRGCACWVNAPSKSGIDSVTTTWPWPMTISFGFVKPRPFVVDGEVRAVATMPLVMVFDRRIMGGGPAGRIFNEFRKRLENAEI